MFLFLSLVACDTDQTVTSLTGIECRPVYDLPCDRGLVCESCYDYVAGDTLWTCSDGWSAFDDDTGTDIAAEVSCRCFRDHLPNDECSGGPFGGVF